MGANLDVAQIQSARYDMESLVFSYVFTSLPVGATTLVNVRNWNQRGGDVWQVDLDTIWTTQHAQVVLGISGDSQDLLNRVGQGVTAAYRAGFRANRQRFPVVSSLSVVLANQSGATISNWATALRFTIRRLTAAEKLLALRAGLTAGYWLTDEERAALQRLDIVDSRGNLTRTGEQELQRLVDKGTQPISLKRMIMGLYEARVTQEIVDTFYPTVQPQATPSDPGQPIVTYYARMEANPTRGRFVVLRGVGVGASTTAILTVDRDGQLGHWQVSLAAFQQADNEDWEVWLPALDSLTVRLAMPYGGSPAPVALRLRVAMVEMSEVLAVRMGRVTRDQLPNPQVYDKALVGLV